MKKLVFVLLVAAGVGALAGCARNEVEYQETSDAVVYDSHTAQEHIVEDYFTEDYTPDDPVYAGAEVNGRYEAVPAVSALKAALLNNAYILEVTPIVLPELAINFYENYEEWGLVYSRFLFYRIRYKNGVYEVMGQVAAPANFMEREYPILIYNRGGNRDFGMLTEPSNVLGLATRGYIVLGSQYRGVGGGTGTEQFGGDDIYDVLRLIDISEGIPFAQQGGVYMFGASRGGMMTYIAARMDGRIRAAAVFAAIANAFDSFNEREYSMQQVYIDLVGGTPDEVPDEFIRRSAVFWADEIRAPVLIGHGGEADWRVPTHHAIQMAEALERYGIPHRLLIYPDAAHGIPPAFLDEVDDWFRTH